jgi:hypothetical protein
MLHDTNNVTYLRVGLVIKQAPRSLEWVPFEPAQRQLEVDDITAAPTMVSSALAERLFQ